MDSYVFGVSKSCLGNAWVESLDLEFSNYATNISQQFSLSSNLARLLAARAVSEDNILSYLNPKIRDLMPSPFSFKDMDIAVGRIIKAITKQENITIYGDYDVDGACSSAMMFRFFQSLGIKCDIFIPNRITDGYGLNPQQLDKISAQGTKLLIAVDCGSNGSKDISVKSNMDVLVLDHHKVNNLNDIALAVVNPNRNDDNSGCNYLCAAGVVFVTICGVISKLRDNKIYSNKLPNPLEYLDMVAMATMCDVVPIIGLNRAFITSGIKIARLMKNLGIRNLVKAIGITSPIDATIFSFKFGPHINAAGRIADQTIGARLLSTYDEEEAVDLANILVKVNKERRAIEASDLENIIFRIESKLSTEDLPSIIIEMGDWHQGVVGLLASRLKDKYLRPTIILSKQINGYAVGSARSTTLVDIGRLIHEAFDNGLVEKGGGHAMAAGLTIKQDSLPQFISFMQNEVAKKLKGLHNIPILKIELITTVNGFNQDLYSEVEKAGPYGAGNPEPLILIKSAYIKNIMKVGDNHLSITITDNDGNVRKAIAFRAKGTALETLLMSKLHSYCHLVGYIKLNYYRNVATVQMELIDAVAS